MIRPDDDGQKRDDDMSTEQSAPEGAERVTDEKLAEVARWVPRTKVSMGQTAQDDARLPVLVADGTVSACPWCGAEKRDGEHVVGCELAVAIGAKIAGPAVDEEPAAPC